MSLKPSVNYLLIPEHGFSCRWAELSRRFARQGIEIAVIAAYINDSIGYCRRGNHRIFRRKLPLLGPCSSIYRVNISVLTSYIQDAFGQARGGDNILLCLYSPYLFARLEVYCLEEAAVGTAGIDYAIVNHRRCYDPGIIMMESPYLFPRFRV